MGTDLTSIGDYEPNNYIILKEKKGSTIITKGDVLDLDSAGLWRECPTTGFSAPYGVAIKSRGTSESEVNVLTVGMVYVKADGTIKPGKFVMPSGTTAGEVIQYAATAIGATPGQSDVEAARDDWKKVVGRYFGKPGANGVGELPADASDGDTIGIIMGGK